MVVLAALAASFSTSTRTQVNLARNIAEAAAAEAIADAAVARAGAGLVVPIAEGGVRTDRTVYQWPFAGGLSRFVVSDEGGKIDLNVASRTLIRNYLEVVGIDQADALAAAIVAYRSGSAGVDPDAFEDGADAGDEGYADGYGQSPFLVLESLQQVPGLTASIYRRIAPDLTVYSDQPEPDPRAALPAVREARARGMGNRGEVDNTIAGEESQWPPPVGPLSIIREGTFTPRSMVGVYTVHSEGRSAGGAVFVRDAVLTVEFGGDRPYSIRVWRQGQRFLFPVPDADEF